jgi:GNAT superfamily N-acetyltransferase
MKLINWVQFTWDLTALPPTPAELPEHYEISAASADDETELRRVITSAFALDPEWNPTMNEVMQTIEGWLANAFESDAKTTLVLRHGARIIGASALDPAGENHLSPGPCILMEYRNRGFGTKLLDRSLRALRDTGLERAIGIAKENSPVTKFLYTKFGGVAGPHQASPLLAA